VKLKGDGAPCAGTSNDAGTLPAVFYAIDNKADLRLRCILGKPQKQGKTLEIKGM
jgi:hypothetical protein